MAKTDKTGQFRFHRMDSVLDVGSRRIVGFALGEHHGAELAYGALAMAVAVRGGAVPGVILHTDQGSEPGFKESSQHRLLLTRLTVARRAPRRVSSSRVSCGGGR
jgi:transposase InsO family protein